MTHQPSHNSGSLHPNKAITNPDLVLPTSPPRHITKEQSDNEYKPKSNLLLRIVGSIVLYIKVNDICYCLFSCDGISLIRNNERCIWRMIPPITPHPKLWHFVDIILHIPYDPSSYATYSTLHWMYKSKETRLAGGLLSSFCTLCISQDPDLGSGGSFLSFLIFRCATLLSLPPILPGFQHAGNTYLLLYITPCYSFMETSISHNV